MLFKGQNAMFFYHTFGVEIALTACRDAECEVSQWPRDPVAAFRRAESVVLRRT
jgi:hypothetical protein